MKLLITRDCVVNADTNAKKDDVIEVGNDLARNLMCAGCAIQMPIDDAVPEPEPAGKTKKGK